MLSRFLSVLLFISSIQSCPLKIVDIRSGCYCGIEIDGTNYIHCHSYSINELPQFTRSYVYDKLNFSKNLIENLTNRSFEHLKVKRIYLEDNPIRTIDKLTFDHPNLLHHLEELYIDTVNNTSLEFLCYGTWRKLRILKLSGFNFNQFQSCFSRLSRLEQLTIENAQIDTISGHLYKLPFLHEFSLIRSPIESFNFDDVDDNALSTSSSIRILNVTFNRLRTIPNDLNIRLPHLITLDLSHNFLDNPPNINEITILNINLSHNLINYFQFNQHNQRHTIDLSFNPICTLEKATNLSNVLLNNLTHLHCDCRLAYFLRNYSIDQSVCATPQEFQGRLVKDLTPEQLMSTCSIELPENCQEVTNFRQIEQHAARPLLYNTPSMRIESSQVLETAEKLNNVQSQLASFRLISFSTLYENNDLLVFWNFDTSSAFHDLLTTQFQIVIEQEFSSHTEIIRRSDLISPYLKQYIIPHLPSNNNYYVCLLVTRTAYGTDKYCRETRTSSNQTISEVLYVNRSVLFGFLFGIILTTCLLVTLAFICHLHYKRKRTRSLFHHQHHHRQPSYMYIDRNDDGTYSHSLVSSPSSKFHHLRRTRPRTTYLTPTPPWFHRHIKQIPPVSGSPCCLLQYHDRTISSSSTTNRITSLSSEYSTGIEKEPMTSTSIMSCASSFEPQRHLLQSPVKHVYEELGDTNIFL